MELDALRSQSGAAQRQAELALASARRGTAPEEGVGGIDARLRLRRARRRATPQPRELVSREVLAPLLCGRGLRFAIDARREVCRVSGSSRPFVRNVEVARAAVDLEHLVRDAVEHVTVVGHEEQAAREGGQPFLEVGDGVEVEVVGRLVEDEGIPLACEQRGERDALLLPARQLVGRRVERTAHTQARKHRFALPLLTVKAVAHRGAHGARRQHRELRQRADPSVAAAAHDARLGLAVAAHHREQRALAAAVETDDADTVAVAEGEREIGEQGAIRAGRPEALCIDQDHASGYGCHHRRYGRSPLRVQVGDVSVRSTHDDRC